MVRPRRILLVSNLDATFVRNDFQALAELGDFQFLLYHGRISFAQLILSVFRASAIVCWFVLGYATTAVFLGQLLRKPVILVVGGWDVASDPEIGYGALLRSGRVWKTRFALRHASAVLAVSEAIGQEVLKCSGRAATIVHNGIDHLRFRPGSGPRVAQVLTVAGVDSEVRFVTKGVDVLLEIAALTPNVEFHLVGQNSREWGRQLTQLAPKNLHVHGFQDREELLQFFQQSAVYLQSSKYESFGVSLAEAMACGCVPVASNRGALPEIVGDAGFLVEYGDARAFARAIQEALHRPDLGERSRERIVSRFTLDARHRALQSEVKRVLWR